MLEFIQQHKEMAFWLTISSALLFFISLSLIPFLLVRIPSGYFVKRSKGENTPWSGPKSIRLLLIAIKNLFGYILLLCGIAMLVLPGQGILTIFLAILLIDFPGKVKFECWLISIPLILKAINKMREKAKRKPLKIPEQ